METNHSVGDGWCVDDPMTLIRELREIRSEVIRIEHFFEHKTQQVHERHKQSARNFLHYLALRQRDVRPLQERLARFGLSSLGRSESHVLANLDAVLNVLNRLVRSEFPLSTEEKGIDIAAGRSALERNTMTLLGPKPAGRDVRIMVTMPSEAASDYHLVRDLVDAGMDCMRINCAHDEKTIWASMVENLDFVRKLRARIRPAPGSVKRCQFDLGKIRVAVPQRCPELRFENLIEGHLQPVE